MLLKPILSSVVIMGLLSIFGINLAGSSSTGYYSVPAADFNEITGSLCPTQNYGNFLAPYYGAGCDFVAGVHLPDGVTVTKITMYWFDYETNYNIDATFFSSTLTGLETLSAGLTSSFSDTENSSSFINTSIPIDNANNEYYIKLRLPTDQLAIIGFRIDYTNQSFLSRINR
jgi:hypothetical protein